MGEFGSRSSGKASGGQVHQMLSKKPIAARHANYGEVLEDVAHLLVTARGASARSVNALMTASYWLVGRRLFEGEQRGKGRA